MSGFGFAFGSAASFALNAVPTLYAPPSSTKLSPSASTTLNASFEAIVARATPSASNTRTRLTGACASVTPV